MQYYLVLKHVYLLLTLIGMNYSRKEKPRTKIARGFIGACYYPKVLSTD